MCRQGLPGWAGLFCGGQNICIAAPFAVILPQPANKVLFFLLSGPKKTVEKDVSLKQIKTGEEQKIHEDFFGS